MSSLTRRQFAAMPIAAMAQPGSRFIKGLCSVAFPKQMPVTDYFATARNAGFEAVEIPLGDTIALDISDEQLKRIADASEKAKCPVASVWCSSPLSRNPLNSPDADKRAQGVGAVKRCIDIAAALRCEAMLLVPARIGPTARYEDTWQRVSAELPKTVSHASEKKVCITIENVWNKFLLSPLEMRAFVDQFRTPWIQAHFDIGNVLQWGYPQDWILTLGSRIRRLHLKDFKLPKGASPGGFVNLLEGDVDWKAVMAAVKATGYRGFVSPEYGYVEGDPDQLKKLSAAADKILAM